MKSTNQVSTKSSKSSPKRARNTKKAAMVNDESWTAQIGTGVSKSMDSMMKVERSTLIWGVAGAATLGAGAYLLYRSWSTGKLAALFRSGEDELTEDNSADVSENLPIGVSGKKPSPSIRDEEGNYDVDGVSYDVQGVIVSSDNHKDLSKSI